MERNIKFEQALSKITQEEIHKIREIVDKCKKIWRKNGVSLNKNSLQMDLIAVHGSCQKLDFDKLLNFNDFNFIHDIGGIIKNLDRKKIELKDCFLPRCSTINIK